MRTLLPAPDAALDPDGHPRTGSFHGGLPHVDLSPMMGGTLRRIARHKRWMYVAIAAEDLFVAVCVVRLGYIANAFAFAYDKREKRMLVDRSSLGPPFACDVGDTAGEGCIASYRVGGVRVAIARSPGSSEYAVEASFPAMSLRARLDAAPAPPAMTAIGRVPGGGVNTTEKRALLAATGEVSLAGTRRSLDGAVAGYDYTNGILARHTAWKWAFALGRAASGERVALNLVEGFVGEAECVAWVDGEVHPLAEGRFAFDAASPLREWTVKSADGGVDLRFAPGGMHAEKRNLGVVSSRFVQAAGTFSGTIRAGGKTLTLDRVLGVTEDQDVLW